MGARIAVIKPSLLVEEVRLVGTIDGRVNFIEFKVWLWTFQAPFEYQKLLDC